MVNLYEFRNTYLLQLKDIKESDAGKYICQVNTGPPVSIGGALNVVGRDTFSQLFCIFVALISRPKMTQW